MDYRIETVIKIIQKNLNNDISLEKLVETVYLNPSYFSALFKQEVEISYYERKIKGGG